jgi:CRP-like cAMP-binding protein
MISTQVTTEDIRGFNLFQGLKTIQLEKIARLCSREHITAQSVIFDPASTGENIFFLEDRNDSVQIEIPIPGYSAKMVIHTLRKGEVFGWAPLGPPHAKTALARSLEGCTLITLNGPQLMEVLENDYEMGYRIMKNLATTISSRLAYTSVVFRREINRLIKKCNEDIAI